MFLWWFLWNPFAVVSPVQQWVSAGNLPHYPTPFSADCVHVPFAITIIIKSRLFRPIIPSVARGRTHQPARRRAPRHQLLFRIIIREWEAKRRGRQERKKRYIGVLQCHASIYSFKQSGRHPVHSCTSARYFVAFVRFFSYFDASASFLIGALLILLLIRASACPPCLAVDRPPSRTACVAFSSFSRWLPRVGRANYHVSDYSN